MMAVMSAYTPRRPARCEFVPVRTLRYHLRQWGEPSAARPPLVLLHDWMDVGASWQFVVDAMARDRYVIAPDWRGFGKTAGGGADNFWVADYLADLDWLLDHVAGERPVDLVGHSLGGNVAMQYAGVRPARVRRLVNLEGFGLPATRPDEAPGRYARWIDELKRLHAGALALHSYADAASVAQRLNKNNPRLAPDKAEWLAREWATPQVDAQGRTRWAIQGEAAHKVVSAQLFRADETLALYAAITAPVLCVEAADDSLRGRWQGRYSREEFHARLQSVRDVRIAEVPDAGHMLHHDQPERVARLIEDFVDGG